MRVALFVAGCNIRCFGCHNQIAWDFQAGYPFNSETMAEILGYLEADYRSGLTILGGEPLDIANAAKVAEICATVKLHHPDKTIWLYTGYNVELFPDGLWISNPDFTENSPYHDALKSIVHNVDVIVDGPFEMSKKAPGLRFKGSCNQRTWRKQPLDWQL